MKHVGRALRVARGKHRADNPRPVRKPRQIGLRKRVPQGKHAALYNTRTWKRLREAWLAEYPLCVLCGALAQHVDHIRRHKGDIALFLDKSNLQSVCADCHYKKTTAERRGWSPQQG